MTLLRNFLNNSMKFFLAFFFLAFFLTAKSGDARTPDLDATMSDVQEFTYDGIDILLRESKEAPVVTAVLFLKGGSSALPASEPASSEYFALNLVPGSGTEFTSKQRYRRVMLRMVSSIGAAEGRDFSLMEMRSTREHLDTT